MNPKVVRFHLPSADQFSDSVDNDLERTGVAAFNPARNDVNRLAAEERPADLPVLIDQFGPGRPAQAR
jgi:hypothetical protein